MEPLDVRQAWARLRILSVLAGIPYGAEILHAGLVVTKFKGALAD